MPDRELRHMRRTELVEIILALKQSEDRLRAENAALSAQLQERQIHIENAGSIAQAALELNKVFEAAQAAADEYVASVLAANKNTDALPVLCALRRKPKPADPCTGTDRGCEPEGPHPAAVRRGNGSRCTQARPDRSGLQGNACPDAAGDPAAPGRF